MTFEKDLLDTESDKKGSQVADYFQGFFHQLIENPVNGVTQIINKSVGSEIPKLEIAGAPERNSVGAIAGQVTGGVLNYMLLSKAANPVLSNLGGEGLRGQMIRAGIVGGIYNGIFMPTDDKSENFLGDRVTSAMVGAATFAAMAGASFKIEQSGQFRVAELRSLGEHLKVGGMSGAIGGAVHSEADALFKKGQILPSIGDLTQNTLSFAAFGAGMGAMQWAGHRISPPKEYEIYSKVPTNDGVENGHIKYTLNQNKDVIRMQADIPNGENGRIGWVSEKMSNGLFRNQGIQIIDGKQKLVQMDVPPVSGIQLSADGLRIVTTDGGVKELKSDGRFDNSRPNRVAEAEQLEARLAAERAAYDPTEQVYINGKKSVQFEPKADAKGNSPGGRAYLNIETGNQLTEMTLVSGENSYVIKNDGPNQWKFTSYGKGNESVAKDFTWRGEIKAVNNPLKPEKTGSLEIIPEGSKTPIVLAKDGVDYAAVEKALLGTAKFTQYNASNNYFRVDNEGNIFLRRGGGSETQIKPGDQITFTYDVGDRYPVWKEVAARWAKSLDGKQTLLNDRPLIPNTITNLQVFNPGY